MKRHPQFVGALAAAAIVAMGLSACTAPGDGTGDSTVDHPTGTLQIISGSADGSNAGFELINEAFMAKYPDVTIEYTPVPNSDQETVFSTRMSAGNVDIMTVDGARLASTPDWVTNGAETNSQLAAANGQFVDFASEAFMDNVNPSVREYLTTPDGKQYAFPLGLSYFTGVFYNKTMFADLGIEVPTTWSEFVDACEKIKASGVAPMGIGGKDGWPAGLPMAAAVQGVYPDYAERIGVDQGLWEGTIALTDPKPVKVLELTQQIWSYAQDNFLGVAYSETPGMFARGDVAMLPDGIWNQPVIESTNPDFEYGYFPLPTSENADDNRYLGGKVDMSLAVLSNSKNLGAAMAYMAFLADPANYSQFIAKAGFAPIEPNIETSDFLKSIEPYTEVFSPAWDQIFHVNADAGPAAGVPFNINVLPPMGTSTPEEAAAAAQADWLLGQQ